MEEEVEDLRLILSSSSEEEEEDEDGHIEDDLINNCDNNDDHKILKVLETVAVINKPICLQDDLSWGIKSCSVKLRRMNLVQEKKEIRSDDGRYERRGLSTLRTDSKTLWSRMRLSMLVKELSVRVEDEVEVGHEKRVDIRRIVIEKFNSVESTPEVDIKIAWMDEAKNHCQPGKLTNLNSTVTDSKNLGKPCQVKLKRFEVLKLYCQQEFVEFEECYVRICKEGQLEVVTIGMSKDGQCDQGDDVTSSTYRECDLSSAGQVPSLSEGHLLTRKNISMAISQCYVDEIRSELESMESTTNDIAGTSVVMNAEEELLRGFFNNTTVQPSDLNLEQEVPDLVTESIPSDSFDDVDLDDCRKLFEGWSFEDVNIESDAVDEFSSFVKPSLMDCESSVVAEDDVDIIKQQDMTVWVATSGNDEMHQEFCPEPKDPLSKLEESIPLHSSQNKDETVDSENVIYGNPSGLEVSKVCLTLDSTSEGRKVDNLVMDTKDGFVLIDHSTIKGDIKENCQEILDQEFKEGNMCQHKTDEVGILGNCLPDSLDSFDDEEESPNVPAEKHFIILNGTFESNLEVGKDTEEDPKSIELQGKASEASLQEVDVKVVVDGVNTLYRGDEKAEPVFNKFYDLETLDLTKTSLLGGTIQSFPQDLHIIGKLTVVKPNSKNQELKTGQGLESVLCSETDIYGNKIIEFTVDERLKENYANKTRSHEEIWNKVEDADEEASNLDLDNQEEKIDPIIGNNRYIREFTPPLSPEEFVSVEDVEDRDESNDEYLSLCEQVDFSFENNVKDNTDAILAKNHILKQAKEVGAGSQVDEDDDHPSDDDLILCEEVNFSSENSEESKNDAYKWIGCKSSGHPDKLKNKFKDDEIMNTNNNSGKHFILCEPDVAENTAKDNKKETIKFDIPAIKKSYEIENNNKPNMKETIKFDITALKKSVQIENKTEPTDGERSRKRSIFDISYDELPETKNKLALLPKLRSFDPPPILKATAKKFVENLISTSSETQSVESGQAAVSGKAAVSGQAAVSGKSAVSGQATVSGQPQASSWAYVGCPHQSPSVTSSTGPSVPPPVRENVNSDSDTDDSSDDDIIILEETEIVETAEVTHPSPKALIRTHNEHSLKPPNILPEYRPVITSADVDLWEKLDPAKLKSKMINSSKKQKEDIRRHGNKKCQSKTVESKMMNVGETIVLTKPPKLKEKKHTRLKKHTRYHKSDSKMKSKETLSSSSSKFKIPKFKVKKTNSVPNLLSGSKKVIKTVELSDNIQTLLEQEGIIDTKDGDWLNFESLYDEVETVKRATNTRILTTDDNDEVVDLERQGQDFKTLKTDKARKKFAQTQFRNPISSDPSRNLQYHGFRSLENKDERSKIQNSSSFSISLGKLEPLSGYKRKRETEDMESNEVVGEGKIKLTDFGSLMKKVFFYKFKQKLNPVYGKFGRANLEDFKTYLGHYKAGLEETANFLSYYNFKEELNLSQTKEVIDLENQFSTYNNYYGTADEDLFCKDCNKKHKFCQ